MRSTNLQIARGLVLSTAMAAVLPGAAMAQGADDSDANKGEEIVVTGTLIRGIAPGGAQSIGVSQEKITAIGAANTSDLIGNIPQTGNFLNYVGVRGSSNFSLAVNRPSLRYLAALGSSTASTLLLLDGHRMPGMGILQVTADLDAISPMAIERVEVVTDGGSSTYGSDAVGGVINFITRKSFDGIQAKASYGVGDKYDQYNASIIAGKAWDWGSAYITYDYSWHDALYGKDREWSRSLNWPLSAAANGNSSYAGGGIDVGSSNNCDPGNLLFGTTRFPLTSTGATGAQYPLPVVANQCDPTDNVTFYPREGKHSVLASFVVDNGGPFSFSLKAFYVNRKTKSDGGSLFTTQDIALRETSPFFRPASSLPISGLTPNNCGLAAPNNNLRCETVQVDYTNIIGSKMPQIGTMEAFGFTPTVKIDLGHDWQLNAMFNYGRGNAEFKQNQLNAAPINAAVNAGTFDPFHLGASGNAAAILLARDAFLYGRATNTLVNMRVVADGSLAQLPGGALKVAVGAEYTHEGYSGITTRSATAAQLAALTDITVGREIKSVFGEVNLPIVGADNRGFIYGLSLSASGRYDNYSDFGSTFNPKFGINFKPTEWLGFRATWGKAFQAPGLSDIAQIGVPALSILPTSLRAYFDPLNPKPAANLGHGTYILTIGGTLPGLKPQKATTWSLGLDLKPPFVPGLEVGMTYYNIDFVGLISNAPINQIGYFFKIFSDKVVTWNGGSGTVANNQALIDYWNALASPANGVTAAAKASAEAQFNSNFNDVYSVLDGRTTNLGTVKTSGIDFYARYNHDTSFGSVYLDVNGTKILTYENGGTTGSLDTWGVELNNTFKVSTTVGAMIGNLRAQGTWNRTDGFRVAPTVQNLQQTYSGGMDVFNLFFQYKVPGDSTIAKDLVLSLNVDNVFDTTPALYRGVSASLFGANGFTLGRVVKFGISKTF